MVSYSWGRFNGFPSTAFLEMALFLLQKHPREEEMAPDDARRGFMMRQIFHLFLLTSLFSLNVSSLFPCRNNNICISVTASGLMYFM